MLMKKIAEEIVALDFPANANPKANTAFVDRVGSPEFFCDLIDEIVSTEETLATVASRSYRHVNHFDKIVLFDDGHPDHARLTLHLWRPPYSEQEIDDELIHDHRFSFWSKVLCGDIRSEVFERAEEEDEDTRVYRSFSYCPEDKDVENFYTYLGDVRLKVREFQQTERDSAYYLHFDSIHRICLPDTQAVATLVLRSPRLRNHSTVFNSVFPTTDVRVRNVFFTPEGVAERLGFLRSQIENRAASVEAARARPQTAVA